jgi:ATP-binding cassette subfamily G (WHITE) protein 2
MSNDLYSPLNADGDTSLPIVGESSRRAKVSMTWKDLSYEVQLPDKTMRKIINGVSGHVHHGQMLALLGPSGAGKTTMLDILAQRHKGGTVTGELHMNGAPVDPSVFRRVSAYVQQEDILHGFLTVRETIEYSATLRLPKEFTKEMITQKATEVMIMLGIIHIANNKIGNETMRGISGGEKKRTAIALELVTDPSLLYLDEPTTGLDTFTALHLLFLLKKLTKGGTTVIFSIHQPRSTIYNLFDVVCVLNGHGEEAYFGPAAQAMGFLSTVGLRIDGADNPADFLLDAVSVVRSAETLDRDDFPFLPPPTQAADIAAAFRSTKLDEVNAQIDGVTRAYEKGSGLPPAMTSSYHRNIFTQIGVVSSRSFINKVRDPIATVVAIIVAIFFALLVGSIYFQLKKDQAGITDRLGVLFFLIMNTAFSSLGSLAMFLFDRTIYQREHRNGMYSPLAYYCGKIVQDVPMSLAVTFLFDAIAYFMVGLRPDAVHFGWFYLINALVMLNSYSLCLFISNISKNYQVANLIAPLVIVLFLLPSGFLINLDSLPIYWRPLKYISFFRYGFEAVVLNEFKGLTFECPPSAGPMCCTDGLVCVDHQLGFQPGGFEMNIVWLAVSAGVYFVLGYLCLRFFRSTEAK